MKIKLKLKVADILVGLTTAAGAPPWRRSTSAELTFPALHETLQIQTNQRHLNVTFD